MHISLFFIIFFFKQKTAYEMRISDWSSDVCSSDLPVQPFYMHAAAPGAVDPPTLELNVKIPTCHTQVAGTEQAFVVAAAAAMAAVRAQRCFFRRRNALIRIFGSPSSEERPVGKECVSKCRHRWWEYTSTTKKH